MRLVSLQVGLYLLIQFSWAQHSTATSAIPIGTFDGVEFLAIHFILGEGAGATTLSKKTLHPFIPGGKKVLEKIIHDQISEQLASCGITVSQEVDSTLIVGVWGRPIDDVPTHSIFLVQIDFCIDDNPDVDCVPSGKAIQSSRNENLTESITETVRQLVDNNFSQRDCD